MSKDINKGNSILKDADEEQGKLVNILKSVDEGLKIVKNIGLFVSEREKVLNNFKSKIFSI